MNRICNIVFMQFAIAALCCCGGHGDKHQHEESEADEHHHHDGIVLEPEKAKAAGVETEVAKRGMFHGVIHTSGRVMSASCDETTVVATISGRVGYNGHISEGKRINAGEKLYTITSAGMHVADGDPVLRAEIEYKRAKRDYERASQLVEDKIISDKDYQLIKAEYENARLTYNATMKNRSAGGVVVASPKGGYVKQNLVKEGDYVEAGQPLLVITQNQHLYLRAEVPERHWKELSSIVSAKFRTSYSDVLYDITQMNGRIQSYGRSAETDNAYIPVIFEFNNTGDVVQGSYAEIYLLTGRRDGVMTVASSALTEEQGVHYIYIKVDDDEYEKREVTLGMSDGERTEIVKGLKPGEKVVVKGAMQVKLASASNAIPAHNHNH